MTNVSFHDADSLEAAMFNLANDMVTRARAEKVDRVVQKIMPIIAEEEDLSLGELLFLCATLSCHACREMSGPDQPVEPLTGALDIMVNEFISIRDEEEGVQRPVVVLDDETTDDEDHFPQTLNS